MPETLQYRFATNDEIPDLARLLAHSFPGQPRPPGWQEQLQHPVFGGGPETLLIGQESGRSVAALQLYPLRQWIAGTALPVAGVGMVAISPAHRKRRFAGDLVTRALRVARERGDVASALYPFRVSFYQKLGYGQAGEALQYQVPVSELPDSTERLRVELVDSESARAEVIALYARWIREQNGQLERTERLWKQLLETTDRGQDRAVVGYRSRDGQLAGYAIVLYRTDLPRPQRYLEVDELVWLTIEARRGLYAWLASLGDQWEQVLVRGLPSHRFGDWVREPRLPYGAAPTWRLWTPGATLLMGPMFRLLDLRAAWEMRRIAEGAPLTVAIDVADDQIEENRGRWRLALGKNGVSVDRESKADLTLRLNISTLSRLYIASLSPAAALEAGLLECGDRPDLLPRLGALLALPEPWTFDRF